MHQLLSCLQKSLAVNCYFREVFTSGRSFDFKARHSLPHPSGAASPSGGIEPMHAPGADLMPMLPSNDLQHLDAPQLPCAALHAHAANAERSMATLETLPIGLLEEVIQNLDAWSLCQVAQVSSALQKVGCRVSSGCPAPDRAVGPVGRILNDLRN